jgi:carboxymethylenebutenolidase
MPAPLGALSAGPVAIAGHDGDTIPAYLATPAGDTPRGSVVVIHHMPGFDSASLEITRRFAALGYAAICPNLHHRDNPGAGPEAAAAASRAAGGVPDARLVGDVAGAVDHLKSLPESNGKVGVVGYCSGGRQAFLVGCELDVDAVVDCYGAFVIGAPPEALGLTIPPLIRLAPKLSAPMLGLFGAEDTHPAKSEVDELESVLTGLGKDVDFHILDGAGHAFFAVDRPTYRPEAACYGWTLLDEFLGKHLGY